MASGIGPIWIFSEPVVQVGAIAFRFKRIDKMPRLGEDPINCEDNVKVHYEPLTASKRWCSIV